MVFGESMVTWLIPTTIKKQQPAGREKDPDQKIGRRKVIPNKSKKTGKKEGRVSGRWFPKTRPAIRATVKGTQGRAIVFGKENPPIGH
jgi:hypothetical protein